jgi:hypothetical protein
MQTKRSKRNLLRSSICGPAAKELVKDLQTLGDWRLIQQLVPIAALQRRRKKEILAMIALCIIIFCCAGPQFGSKPIVG